MNDEFIADAWLNLCTLIHVETRKTSREFVQRRWGLSKTRVKRYCDFVKFCKLCRENNLPQPNSPDVIDVILRKKQSLWLDYWAMCVQQDARTPGAIEHIVPARSNAPSVQAREKMALARAAKNLNSISDGSELAHRLGPKAFPKDWENALRNAIDADQERMNMERDHEPR
jgi:hypothetical protein